MHMHSDGCLRPHHSDLGVFRPTFTSINHNISDTAYSWVAHAQIAACFPTFQLLHAHFQPFPAQHWKTFRWTTRLMSSVPWDTFNTYRTSWIPTRGKIDHTTQRTRPEPLAPLKAFRCVYSTQRKEASAVRNVLFCVRVVVVVVASAAVVFIVRFIH